MRWLVKPLQTANCRVGLASASLVGGNNPGLPVVPGLCSIVELPYARRRKIEATVASLVCNAKQHAASSWRPLVQAAAVAAEAAWVRTVGRHLSSVGTVFPPMLAARLDALRAAGCRDVDYACVAPGAAAVSLAAGVRQRQRGQVAAAAGRCGGGLRSACRGKACAFRFATHDRTPLATG